MSCKAWAVTSKGQREGKITKCVSVCMRTSICLFKPESLLLRPLTWHLCVDIHARKSYRERAHIKKHFPLIPDSSHVDCISIRGQEWLVISQGSDSENGPSGTLCHSAPVRACPIDPAQLSKSMRDARLRSSRDGLCCQGLWMMYNIRMVFVL